MNEPWIAHDQMSCDLCKAAGAQQEEHYALGRLRFRIGRELHLSREATKQLDLSTLFRRRGVPEPPC